MKPPKSNHIVLAFALLTCLSAFNSQLSTAHAQGTAFTYQGRLNSGTNPATGIFELRFMVYDAVTNGSVVAVPLTNSASAVTNGLFAVTLDFGSGVFTGPARWLQLDVRTNGSGAFTTLLPRQQLLPTPYAIMANTASNLLGTLPAAQLSGTLPASVLAGYSGTVTLTNGGNSFNGTFSGSFGGSGAGLTTINANNLSSGSVPSAALSNAWKTTGNSGTMPGTQFIGTSDNQPLEFKVNGVRALRLAPDVFGYGAPNLIGGSPVNFISPLVVGAVIAGGGITNNGGSPMPNSVSANFGTIGGGFQNTIQADYDAAMIGGGVGNTTAAGDSVIGGGSQNTIQGYSDAATIGGGWNNTIQNNIFQPTIGGGYNNTIQTYAAYSTISGGRANTVGFDDTDSTIGGGRNNTIQVESHEATIGGGGVNLIQGYASDSTISGGWNNVIQTNASSSTIGGGIDNTIQGNSGEAATGVSTIGGGWNNTIQGSAPGGTIAGGQQNTIQSSANCATVGGGSSNTVSGSFGTIPGGQMNVAAQNSFAAGFNAQATNSGAFVWSDASGQVTASTNNNSVTMRASGGVRFFSNSGMTAGVSLAPGGTAWGTLSDRNAKKNFAPVNNEAVLEKLSHVPVQQWNYKWESDGSPAHLGPMAQDFKSAFYPGTDDKGITTLEFDGVELAAIQGLNQKLEQKEMEITELKARLSRLERLVNQRNGGTQ